MKIACAHCRWNGKKNCTGLDCLLNGYDNWSRSYPVAWITLAVVLVVGAAFALTCWVASCDPHHNAAWSPEAPVSVLCRHYKLDRVTTRYADECGVVVYESRVSWRVTGATLLDFYHSWTDGPRCVVTRGKP